MKHKLAIAFGILVLLVGFNIDIKPGQFRALAQAGVCQFAAYGPGGSLINTTITCVTPAPSGSGVTAVTATATACGAAVSVTTPFPSPLVQVPVCPSDAPQLTPSPGATSTSTAGAPSCVWSGSFPYTLGCNFPAGVAQTTPSPSATSTSTAGPPSCVFASTFPYQLVCNFPVASGGSGVNLQAAGATPTPQVGNIGLNGSIYVGPTPNPSGTDTPSAFKISANSGCGNVSNWGTNGGANVSGVNGSAMMVNCGSVNLFALNQNGLAGFANGVEGSPFLLTSSGNINFPTSSSTGQGCNMNDGVGGFGAIQIKHSGTGTCSLQFNDVGVAYAGVCFDANASLISCSAQTRNEGQVSCALSTLVCTATATVRSGAVCTASYDTAATTVTAALLLPLTVKVVTTTLSVGMQGAATATGTAAADYICL